MCDIIWDKILWMINDDIYIYIWFMCDIIWDKILWMIYDDIYIYMDDTIYIYI